MRKILSLYVIVAFLQLLSVNSIQAQTVVEFNSPGTFSWTPPPGTISYYAEVWAGGASGNSVWGGGGGQYAKSITYTDYFGAITVEVGAGGTGGNNGVDSKFRGCWAYRGLSNNQGSYYYYGGEYAAYYYGGGGGSGTTTCFCFGGYAAGGGGGSGYTNASGGYGSSGIFSGCGFSNNNTNGQGGGGSGNGGNGGVDGGFPGGGGGSATSTCFGAYYPAGAGGKVKITYFCNQNPTAAGTIGNAHTVTSPTEKNPDHITSITNASGYGIVYSWEYSTDNVNWAPAPGSSNTTNYVLPTNLTQDTWFRRRTNACGVNTSNAVKIKVFTTTNGFKKGRIRGKVKSVNGTPVAGIQITVQKTVSLLGSSQTFTYTTTTDVTNGKYDIPGIFWGDPTYGADPATVSFTVTPYKLNHTFSPVQTVNFTNVAFDFEDVDFTDSTVYSITGKTYQECTTCVDINGVPQASIIAPLDSVLIYRNNSYVTTSGYIDPPAAYGRWATTVADPLTYTITPSYNNHAFVPSSWTQLITNNVANVDFKDTTTHVVSGFLRAGCNDYLGRVELEFADVLHDLNGQPYSVFRKRVITNAGSGFFSVRLPARQYKVRVVDFTSPAITNPSDPDYIYETDLQAFFNTNFDTTISANALPYDSLLTDVTKHDDTLNLVYQRPPSITLYGITDNCNLPAYVRWKQAELKSFGFVVYQGSPAKGCRLSLDSVRLSTNVHVQDVNEIFNIPVVNDTAKKELKAGEPNILSPYYKVFFATYEDRYHRPANLTLTGQGISRNVIVTGIKSDTGFFATVSPELPVMVVHDPPGDLSFSTWTSTETNETAMRWNVAAGIGVERFASVKLGTKIETGLGVSTEAEFWGTLNNKLSVNTRFNGGEETIMTTTSTQSISTSSDENTLGADGDVFMGGAVNLLYSIATVISDSATCLVSKTRKLIVAQDGFATNYYYTDFDIRNDRIPTIIALMNNPGNTPEQTANYANQISLWQQILANNEFNKARAAFVQNISFFGSSGPLSFSTTASSSKTSSFDFNLEIENSVAAELGLEVAGSGVNGGASVAFKMETGVSTNNTTTEETTIGYTLDDNEPGDNFSVNIKKDPVYNTPVFETVAGQSSCPPEAGTYHRDAMQLIIPIDVVTGVAPGGDAIFTFLLGNLSQDPAPRTYNLTFDQSSNPDGATVLVGGSPVIGGVPTPYPIAFNGQTTVNVVVRKNLFSNVYSYEGLRFILSDDCDGSISKTGTISAHFISPCSAINLVTPEDNWIHRITDNNIIPIQFDGYVLANLTSVSLEYSTVGTSNWSVGFIRSQAQISIGANGTSVNWDVSLIPDGEYKIRLKLTCPTGTVYTTSVTGIIDRIAPALFGIPEPTDNNYVAGDLISFSYDEDLDNSGLNNNIVTMTRLSNNGIIPVSVAGYGNKISISPSVNLMQFAGDSIRVVVNGVKDIYGNVRTTPDTAFFLIGPYVPGSGPKAVNVAVSFSPKFENASGTMNAVFTLPSSATVSTRVNFTLGGTATYNGDYTIDSVAASRLSGVEGFVIIPQGSTQASVLIDPIADNVAEQDETITIAVTEGGDYVVGANYIATATILSDDLIPPTITASGSTTLCTGNSVTLTADSTINTRFASAVLNFSSEYYNNGYGTADLLGAPDVYPNYGDYANAWSPSTITGPREFLVLAFDDPAPINFVDIYETFNPGAVDTVYVKNPATGLFQVVYTATAAPAPQVARIKHITFPTTLFSVSEVRIALRTSVMPDWVEIDAVSIGNAYTNYLWSTGALTKSITVNSAGTYSVTVSNSYGITATSAPVVITVNPTFVSWYQDTDGDNYGNLSVDSLSCIQPVGYVLNNTDCDDSRNTVNPGASEICDNLDNDCDAVIDEDLPLYTFYWDGDGDGYGVTAPITVACGPPVGYSYVSTDCNDGNLGINPGVLEICNGVDDNCNGLTDDSEPGVYGATYWYADADADGFGDVMAQTLACTQPFGYVGNYFDCDDQNSNINPNNTEVCNGIDDDCNLLADDGDPTVTGQFAWYEDVDGDGYGNPVFAYIACIPPMGWVSDNTDCDDTSSFVNPGSSEVCNYIDDDCDGLIDSDDPGVSGMSAWYADNDNDGFGDGNSFQFSCYQVSGYVGDNTDCNDQDQNINPGVQETCGNGIDDNCDGQTDELGSVVITASGPGTICAGDTVNLTASVFGNNLIRYATAVTGFSSEYDPGPWGSIQTLGAPNLYPTYGDISSAWASATPDDQREYIQLSYDNPAPIDFIDIYETYSPGAVDTVYVKNPNTGLFTVVYTATASALPPVARILHITFPLTSFNVSEIRIAMNSVVVPDWNEIDAVAIGRQTSYLWSTGATTQTIFASSSGNYTVQVSSGGCQSSSAAFEVTVLPAPLNWYVDMDGDGFGVGNTAVMTSCANPGAGYASNNLDCDDTDYSVNPNVMELCNNGKDDDCDGIIDTDAILYNWYLDNDLDNYGNPLVTIVDCIQPANYVIDNTDCDDNNYYMNPGFAEVCDYIDNNCDGQVDEGVTMTLYGDLDSDGFGNQNAVVTCSPLTQHVFDNTDCDDGNAFVYPGAAEVCNNSIDDNCNGAVDENNALAFDGADYAEGTVSDLPQGNAPRTMEAWIKTTQDGMVALNWGTISSNERCGMLVVGGRLYFVGEYNDDIGNIVVNDGLWHHIAVSFDGTDLKGYVDGVLDINSSKSLNTNGNVLRIGRRAVPDDGEYFNGEIDEVRIWDVARTQAEIQSSMNFVASPQAGLIAYYKFDDGLAAGQNTSITTLHDVSSNAFSGKHLTLFNFDLNNGNTTANFVANSILFYQDADGDGYGNAAVTTNSFCGTGYVRNSTDCNDGEVSVNPGAIEACGNSIDDNCNGAVDEGCCSGAVVTTAALYEDFESGSLASGWSATGLWHVSSSCTSGTPPNPTQWAYYGQDGSCNFNTGGTNSGDLTSATVSIPATASRATLRFSYIYNGEAGTPPYGYDNASVLISVNGAPFAQAAELSTTGSQGLTWLTAELDLSAYAGSDVAVRWNFNSADGWYNDVLGLQVDSVALTYVQCCTDVFYADNDGDGYGAGSVIYACSQPAGTVTTNTDCDDNNAAVNPGENEVCNNMIDDNCDGLIDANNVTAMYEDFESGVLASGWSASGLWHVSSSCSSGTPPGPVQWAYYGLDGSCTYDNGSATSGDLISSAVAIPASATSAKLRFRYIYNGEGGMPPFGYDNASVQISVNGGGYVMAEALSTTGSAGVNWLASEVDLSAYIGSTVTVKWNFNSGDNWYNSFLGLQIDSVALSYINCCADSFYADADLDGYGAGVAIVACVQPPGTVNNHTDCDDNNVLINPAATEVCNNLLDDNCDGQIDEGCGGAIFNITAFIEGFYNGAGGLVPALMNAGISMNPAEVDTVRIELRDQISPTTIIANSTAILNTSGQVVVAFPATVIGQNGYIVIFHRNAIQTWSEVMTFAQVTNYNFTTTALNAYGANMIQVAPGIFAFYSGDVNQDEVVDIIDQANLDNDVFNFAGGYVLTDLNGDGFVDITDQSILDNNIFNFIGSIHP